MKPRTAQDVLDHVPGIYAHIREHPGLLPDEVTLEIFQRWAMRGLELYAASRSQAIFDKLKKQFNSI